MKKFLTPSIQFVLICLLYIGGMFVFSQAASAALFKLSPNTGEVSDSSEIRIIIDTENQSIESAAAVMTFDPSRLEIVNVLDGGFFDNLAIDTSQNGEVAVIGTPNIGDIEGKTGMGTFATMVISPKITSGNIALNFRCSSTEMDDSNILDTDGTNLLATNAQCARNVEGSYTILFESGTGTTDTGGQQPVMPEELPETGPRDWLKWIVSGLAFIGVGLLLF